MPRYSNTTTSGQSFDESTIQAVWDKAKEDPGFNIFKKDVCSATIKQDDYGETTAYGWEIDHIKPVSQDGSDSLNNLQPLHWENNRYKGGNYPNWNCKKKS